MAEAEAASEAPTQLEGIQTDIRAATYVLDQAQSFSAMSVGSG